MKFEKPNSENKPQKANNLKEKIKGEFRNAVLASGIASGVLGGAYIANDRYAPDYTNAGTFNTAFKKARQEKRKFFKWKDKYYTTELVNKEFSDNYWESKEFLKEYYSSDYFKSKEYMSEKEAQRRIDNLNEATYFSITNQKGSKSSDGSYDIESKSIFIYGKKDDKRHAETTAGHELTHKATMGNRLIDPLIALELRNLARESINSRSKEDPYLESKYDFYTLQYLSDPTEIDARQNETRFWLFKHFPGYKADTVFTEEHFDFLQKNYEILPYAMQQLLDIFPRKEVFISNMNKF